jgi:hypothetical protein
LEAFAAKPARQVRFIFRLIALASALRMRLRHAIGAAGQRSYARADFSFSIFAGLDPQ